ncbi:MAG: ThiF family adenylyltransferase [Leptonema sp. (in: bacteria)]
MDLKRFSRQIIIQDLGLEGQYILSQSKVLIIGLGGLGCPAAIYLSLAGIGKIGLFDFDKVDITNLQRQPLYKEEDVGSYKVEAAKKNLLEYNQNLEVEIYKDVFTYEKKHLVRTYDLILDCTDTIATRKIINQVSLEENIPFIFCSLDQWSFQLALFNFRGGPCFECLYPNLEDSQMLNCIERGILGPVSGIAGVYLALEAIKFLVNLNPLNNELLYFDLLSNKNLKLKINKNQQCLCNGYANKLNPNNQKRKEIKISSISLEDLSRLDSFTVIDLRESNETTMNQKNHFKKVKQIALKELPYKVQEIPKDEPIVVMCNSGFRAKQAATVLYELKFSKVFYLEYDPLV